MASSSDFDSEEVENLGQLFNKGLAIYNDINNSDEPTNSSNLQSKIKEAINTLEKATQIVSCAGVFSRNEGINEISTNDLQYFLLPALLGSLTLKLTTGERGQILEVSEIYFKDFLERCSDYELTDQQPNTNRSVVKVTNSEIESMLRAANTRENKIQRLRQQKELKSNLENLKQSVESEHVDEDIKRDYFITMIKSFILESIDELQSIQNERPILEYLAKMKKDGNPPPQKQAPPPPLKPIIITKDVVQKAVFGAGYPSLPTMTVQEFYDKRVRDGVFPDPNKKSTGMTMQEAALKQVPLGDEELEEEERENRIEADDPELLERMRQMDEFKDEHRRGWGNRMNRS